MWCERNDECRRLSSRTIAPCTAAAAAAATAAATPCKSTAVTICVVSDRADPDCIRWNVSLPRIALLKKNRMVRSSNAFGFHVFLLFRVSFRFFSHIFMGDGFHSVCDGDVTVTRKKGHFEKKRNSWIKIYQVRFDK